MDNPLAIIAYIAISAVIAILLLVFAPVVLLDYGLAIAWGWLSILLSWIAVEMLHADFEDEQESKRQAIITGYIKVVNNTAAVFISLGDACRSVAADINHLAYVWEEEKRAKLLGEDYNAS